MSSPELAGPPSGHDARRRFLQRSGWFDRDFYLAHAPAAVGPGDDLIEHYLTHGAPAGLAPNAEIAGLQDGTDDPGMVHGAAEQPPEDDPQLALEVALVRASGLFDADFYRRQLTAARIVLKRRDDPLVHFCRRGWREVLRPSADFDVWWYWTNYLDPQREALNPLVHFLLLGRDAGHSGMPARRETRAPLPLPRDRPVRRVCLFAGYDKDGLVDDYVVDYVRELSRHADVYYLCDGHLLEGELAKLADVTVGAWAMRHSAYDFGSYSMLAGQLVGWDVIEGYDELLLVNDSSYLVRDLDAVFARMQGADCDWWGLQATKGLSATSATPANSFAEPIPLEEVRRRLPDFERDEIYDFHVGSYFLAYRRAVIEDHHFRRLLDSVHHQRSKLTIILKYEVGLTRYLVGNGYRFETFVDALYPFHPMFSAWYFTLLEQGFPLLKKLLLYRNHYDVPDLVDWKARVLASAPDAPVETFERNLLRTAPHDELQRSFAVRTGPDGQVHVPRLLERSEFRALDRSTPTYDHWWAFLVEFDSHLMPPNSRAIFEQVRDDPSVKKIVLTRSRPVDLTGTNVVVVPLSSPEGQHHLVRSGHVLIGERPSSALKQLPLSLRRHHLVLVRGGLALRRFGHARRLTPARREPDRSPVARGLLTSSSVDQLAMMSAHQLAAYESCWRTGVPATDFLLGDLDRLPADLQDQEVRLRAELGGRRLVLFLPARGRSTHESAYPFSDEELAWLARWTAEHDVVLGLREHAGDREHTYLHRLRGVATELSAAQHPDLSVLLRVADVLLTDVADPTLDFLATGRPVVSFVHDLDEVAETLFYDLDHVLPEPVCRDFAALASRLERVFDPPDERARLRYERSRQLFFDHVDADNARRAAEAIRRSYVREDLA